MIGQRSHHIETSQYIWTCISVDWFLFEGNICLWFGFNYFDVANRRKFSDELISSRDLGQSLKYATRI